MRHWLTVRTAWSSFTPGVPDGVPDAVGQAAQVVAAERPPVVQQDEVHVAERAGVTAGQAADGGQRHALGRLPVERLGPHLAEPVAGQVGDAVTAAVPGAGRVEAPGPARSRRRAARSVCSIVMCTTVPFGRFRR